MFAPSPFDDSSTALRLISECLTLVERFGGHSIAVRDVRMAEDTLLIEITARSDDRIRARGEIGNVMAALSGLDVTGTFPILDVQWFGVRAFSVHDDELLWILSSVETARLAVDHPLEWLANSIVQDNTPHYRRSQADRKIAQVEHALRDLIDEHATNHIGSQYVDVLWESSRVKGIRTRGRSDAANLADSREVLEYAYLTELRDAVLAHIDWFDDDCVAESSQFEASMVELNRVRRKVAHNREISSDDVAVATASSSAILAPIGLTHPAIVSDFMSDRWDFAAAEIMNEVLERLRAAGSVPDRSNVHDSERLRLAVKAMYAQVSAADRAIVAFSRLAVPPQRLRLHDTVVEALTTWRDSTRTLVETVRPGVTARELTEAHARYELAWTNFRNLSSRVKALRLGLDSATL